MKNIVIVGFMGTGKSVVAKEVAKRLGLQYVSMDKMIEGREGRQIKEIFAQDGEDYFRKIEKEITKELSRKDDLVIDAGGGVVIDDENVRNLKSRGIMVSLSARADVILSRTDRSKDRPLLNVPDPKRRIEELLAARAAHYARADFHIDTSDKKISDVVEEVIRISNEAGD